MFRKRVFLLAASVLLAAAADEPRWLALNHQARAAIQAKDYAKLREALLELKPLMPGNPRITYNLAAAEAMLGNRDAALARLRNFAGMGVLVNVNADPDFASLRGTMDFTAIAERIDQNRDIETHAETAFTLAEPDLIPEDIAYDAGTSRFFVSSVRKGKILTGDGREFAKAEGAILALVVDGRRKLLWATTGSVPQCEICKPEDKDKTALLAFDLGSGALKKHIDAPSKGLLGDMTVASRGDIYVSDGRSGAVYHLASGAQELERLDRGEFPSPQTPALSKDGKTLYIPDYARGIAAMDLASRAVEWLVPADDIALAGIDGLYVYGDSFLAVQNGITPPRIVSFTKDLKHAEVLEANYPLLGEPTHGVFVKNVFYFLRNTGWNAYDDAGKKKAGVAPVQSSVGKIAFPK